MNLQDIIRYRFVTAQQSLDENGVVISRPSSWYLVGRTILWFLTFGYCKVNPSLDKGTQKVIHATRHLFRSARDIKEMHDTQAYDHLEQALTNLKILSIWNGGNKSTYTEIDQLILTVDLLRKRSKVLSNSKASKNSKAHLNKTFAFVDDIRNGRIADGTTFLQKVAIFYPEMDMYKQTAISAIEIEKERTELSLLFVYLLCKHDEKAEKADDDQAYQDFIRGQLGQPHLNWGSFKELSAIFKKKYDTDEKLDFFLMMIIFQRLGKVDFIQKLSQRKNVGMEFENHELLDVLERQPKLFASFDRLPKKLQRSAIDLWSLNYFDLPFMQGEYPPAALSKISKKVEVDLDLAEHCLYQDLACFSGSMGFGKTSPDKTLNGCRLLDENTYQAWKKTFEQLTKVKNEKEIYKNYLKYRAKLFDISKRDGVVISKDRKLNLNVENSEDYAFIRFCCMLRLFYHEDILAIKKAFEELKQINNGNYRNLISELTCTGLDGKKAIFIDFVPLLIVNIVNYPFPDRSKKIDVLIESLRLLHEIYQVTREHLDDKEKGNGIFKVNVSEIALKFSTPTTTSALPGILTLDAVRKCLSKIDGITLNAKNKHIEIHL